MWKDLITLSAAPEAPGTAIFLTPKSGETFSSAALLECVHSLLAKYSTHSAYGKFWKGPAPTEMGRYLRDADEFEYGDPEGEVERALIAIYHVPKSLKKEDWWVVARRRKLPYTGPALWKFSAANLEAEVLKYGPLTGEEEACVAQQRSSRETYCAGRKATTDMLKQELKDMGLSVSAGMTKMGIVDKILSMRDKVKIALDEYQQGAIDQVLRNAPKQEGGRTLVCAGPGAGKTTTLTRLIAALVDKPQLRVLVLVFNVEAETTLKKRLKMLGVNVIPKNKVMDPSQAGCAAMTFDKFAYQITAAAEYDIDDLAAPSPPAAASYRGRKEEAAVAARTCGVHWDVLIVDEAQDVTLNESGIVDGLLEGDKACHLVCAGDPRQEIYSGARWFSELWTSASEEEKRILYVNYRSRPEIVRALNAYSRAAFPQLHHDQVAVRESTGDPQTVSVYVTKWKGIGEDVGRALAQSQPGASYGLVPVTLEKFKMNESTLAAYQTLHDLRPGTLTLRLTKDAKVPKSENGNAPIYILATAKKIKGTERPLVVVYGTDRDYDVVVDNMSLAKLIFVALSRAQDRLVLITRKLDKQRIKTLMQPFIEAAGFVSETAFTDAAPSKARKTKMRSLVVNDDSCGIATIAYDIPNPPATEHVPNAIIEFQKGYDYDFMGCLAEALVLNELQAIDMTNYEIKSSSDTFRGISRQDDKLVITVRPGEAKRLAAIMEDTEFKNPAFLKAVVDFTIRSNKLWTASMRLLDDLEEAEKQAKAIGEKLVEKISALGFAQYTIKSMSFRSYCIGDCRTQRKKGGTVDYAPDAVFARELDGDDKLVLELKHTKSLTDYHQRQLRAYMHMENAQTGILFNSQTGELQVHRIGRKDTDFDARAKTLQTILYSRSVGLANLAQHKLMVPHELKKHSVYIFLDAENDERNEATEIGAIAVSATDFEIIGVFNATAPGVVDLDSEGRPRRSIIEKITGLGGAVESDELYESFHQWLEISKNPAFLHWGGSEKTLVPAGATCIDIYHRIFRPWLALRGETRSGATGLEDAVRQVLPELKYIPHQATEDALAALGMFIALTH